jgi:hypothetical protein
MVVSVFRGLHRQLVVTVPVNERVGSYGAQAIMELLHVHFSKDNHESFWLSLGALEEAGLLSFEYKEY